MRLFVPRTALRGLQIEEPSDSQKFAAAEVEMQFFDGLHEDNFYYGETEEIKAQRLGTKPEGSSVKFVGELWLGKLAKRMI